MLEFMGIIADREKASIEADETSGALKSLNLQQDFLMSSILNWYPRFHALSNKVVETRFYRGVLKLTKGYLLQEKQEINVEQRALKRGINQA